ncbi:MAG: response regulator [Thermotogaceae bacterium]|nr:response regulator [Thermotogaceae bacterium]
MDDRVLKILIVEDNPVDVFLMKSLLSKGQNFQTHITVEPSLAAGLARIQLDIFDIVILDLSLSDSWGLETLNRVRKINESVPIIVITSHDDEKWGVEALKNGAQDYILKNQLNAVTLKRTIQFAIERESFYQNLKNKADELEILNQINRDTANKFEAMAMELLRRLSKVAQARDHVTGSHTERVGVMASILGRGIGLSAGESEILRQVAPLHDLGKVGIPDRILRKPGSLNDKDWGDHDDTYGLGVSALVRFHPSGDPKSGTDRLDSPREVGRDRLPKRPFGSKYTHRGKNRLFGRRLRRADQQPPL